MTHSKDELFRSLALCEISDEEFLVKYRDLAGQDLDEGYCLDLLSKGLAGKSEETVSEALAVADRVNLFSRKFSPILCQLLKEDWHTSHEDIAMTLRDLKDPATIDSLFHASTLSFDYLDYDDTCQFARKCIKALSYVENDAANDKLRLLAQHENSVIREYALKELIYKGLI
jgi:hypothetical protein